MGLSLTRRDLEDRVDLVVRGLVDLDLVDLDLVGRGLVDRDRVGLADPVDLDPAGLVGRHRVDLADMRGRAGLAVRDRAGLAGQDLGDLAVRVDLVGLDLVGLDRVGPVDMRGRVDPAVRDRLDPVDLAVRVDLDLVDLADMQGRVDPADRVDPAVRVDTDLADLGDRGPAGRVDLQRSRTRPGALTSGVAPRWAAPGMRRTASAHLTTVRRLRRDNTDSAGMVGLLPERRRLSGMDRRPRVAGAVHRLPVVGTAHGMVRRATSQSRRPISGRSITTATTRSRSSTRCSADGASGSSESGSRCTDTT